MTSKLITAFIDNGEKFGSLEEAVMYFDSSGYDVEGIRRNEGRDSNGLHVGNGFGFTDELAQVRTFTVEYTATEEFAISLVEEQNDGDSELEDGDVVRPSEPEGDSGLDEGVEPSGDIEPDSTGAEEPPSDQGSPGESVPTGQ